jgi:ribonuclease HIII
MDSKRIGDSRIHPIAEQIEKRCPSRTVCIGPKKYNQLYSRFRNLNTLLAWAHCACIRGLSETCSAKRVLVDRFATTGQLERFVAKECPGIRLEQKVRGEADPAVAAASILARSVFLRELKRLSRSCGQDLPKGAGNPVLESAVQFAGAFGIDGLGNVAKMHFKTAEVVKDRFEKGKNGFSERGEANGR